MYCTKCGEELREQSVFCHRCGKKVNEREACESCGKELGRGDLFCAFCGYPTKDYYGSQIEGVVLDKDITTPKPNI